MLDHQDFTAVQAAAQLAVQAALGSHNIVAGIERWGGGAHNTGFKLLLNDGQWLFMKIEKGDIFPRTRRCQIEREVHGICLAARAGIDVPEIIGYDYSGNIAGCRYLLEAFIDRDLLGQALDGLSAEQSAPLLAEFERRTAKIYAIRGAVFGELYPGGWLGQFTSWREMLTAFSTILLEDAATLGQMSEADLTLVREAHAAALETITWQGPAILTHNDLHVFNVFVDDDNGALRVGKLFDFGLSLFQGEYVSCFGPNEFDGKEAKVARRFNVSEDELRGYALFSALEFVNFAGAIRFAPDKPYGYLARRKNYLAACQAYLNR